jgi:hypothetical protein
MILQLGVQKGSQIHHAVHLCVLDILHAAEHVVIGFFVLDILTAQLFFHSEIFSLRLLHL